MLWFIGVFVGIIIVIISGILRYNWKTDKKKARRNEYNNMYSVWRNCVSPVVATHCVFYKNIIGGL